MYCRELITRFCHRGASANAGIGWATRTVGKDGEYASAHDLDLYRKVIEINLIGTFNVCRLAATAMSHNTPDVDNMRGALLNTASVAAETPIPTAPAVDARAYILVDYRTDKTLAAQEMLLMAARANPWLNSGSVPWRRKSPE